MHILVTNDDGIQAPGLHALAQSMRALGRVTVLAPDRNWSASGHVKTLHRPLRVRETILPDGTTGFASDGAPSDCVALAVLGFTESIDVIVSGINPHANLGHDVTYSGTVTAAMEGAITGLPGIAVSVDTPEDFKDPIDYSGAAAAARHVVELAMKEGMPRGVLLNVNVPYLREHEFKGYLITRQGLRVYRDRLDKRVDPRGSPYYWIGGDVPTGVIEEGTDFGALAAGFVSITPLQLDLTAYQSVDEIKGWKWNS